QERIAGGGTGRDLLSQRKSGNKVLVCRVEENDRRPQFAARPLVEFNPNQDDFTGSKGHGSAVSSTEAPHWSTIPSFPLKYLSMTTILQDIRIIGVDIP